MNPSPELILVLKTFSPLETIEAGKLLGKSLRGGETITLSGLLGTGKTSFVKGIGSALNIDPDKICSPTFILRAEYRGKFPLAHIDLYRLDSPGEIQRLGLFDQEPPETILLIEWPEKGSLFLPSERLAIEFSCEAEEERKLSFTLFGSSYPYLMKELT